MKRTAIIALGIVVVAALGWSVFWLVGKGRIEEGVAREVARIEADGWKIVTGARSVGGFPLGYRLQIEDVAATHGATGVLVRLPEIAATSGLLDASRITALLPERFTVDMPVPEAERSVDPSLPRVLTLVGASRDLRLSVGAGPDGTRDVTATAAGVTLTVSQPDYPRTASLTLEAVDAGATLGLPRSAHRLAAESIVFRTADAVDGPAMRTELGASRVSATLDTDLATLGGAAAMLYQGEAGELDIVFQTGAVRSVVAMAGDPARPDGELTLAAASASGRVAASGAGLDLRAELRDNRWTLTPADPGVPYRGGVLANLAEFRYRVPMAPSPQPGPGAFRLALAGVAADDALWRLVDPDAVLDRTPGSLTLDVEGTLRVTRRIDLMPPGARPPFEVSNLVVKEVALAALGAAARASGDIEFVQPIGQPVGTLAVEMSGIRRVIDALGRAGVLTEDIRTTAEAMLEVYARPAEGDDAWASDVTFGEGGITVNGLKVP